MLTGVGVRPAGDADRVIYVDDNFAGECIGADAVDGVTDRAGRRGNYDHLAEAHRIGNRAAAGRADVGGQGRGPRGIAAADKRFMRRCPPPGQRARHVAVADECDFHCPLFSSDGFVDGGEI